MRVQKVPRFLLDDNRQYCCQCQAYMEIDPAGNPSDHSGTCRWGQGNVYHAVYELEQPCTLFMKKEEKK